MRSQTELAVVSSESGFADTRSASQEWRTFVVSRTWIGNAWITCCCCLHWRMKVCVHSLFFLSYIDHSSFQSNTYWDKCIVYKNSQCRLEVPSGSNWQHNRIQKNTGRGIINWSDSMIPVKEILLTFDSAIGNRMQIKMRNGTRAISLEVGVEWWGKKSSLCSTLS